MNTETHEYYFNKYGIGEHKIGSSLIIVSKISIKIGLMNNMDFVYHNDNGPSVLRNDGLLMWYVNGKCHRLSGPAIVYPAGDVQWYINDWDVTQKIYRWSKHNDIDLFNLSDVDIALIKLTWANYNGRNL